MGVKHVYILVALDPRKRDQQIFRKDLLFEFIEFIMCVALVVSDDQSGLSFRRRCLKIFGC